MIPNHTGNGRAIKAVEHSTEIISKLHNSGGASITELSEQLPLSKGSIHTHLHTLESAGIAVNEGEYYRLSLQFLSIGEKLKRDLLPISVIQPELESLSNECGHRVQLIVEEYGKGVCIAISRPENTIIPDKNIGDWGYLHCTAAGKSILAHYSKEQVLECVKQQDLPKRTDQTITDVEELLDETETIRDQGYGLNDEEKMKGLRAVGAPIIHEGEVLGAISISGTRGGLEDTRFREELPQKLMSAVSRIEMNYTMSQDT